MSAVASRTDLDVCLDLVALSPLMHRTEGRSDLVIGLIDGPISVEHPALASGRIREAPGSRIACATAGSLACMHGTFVAGILSGRRGSGAAGICAGCTLLIRPLFGEAVAPGAVLPSATPAQLAQAIVDCLAGGATVINISAAIDRRSSHTELPLKHALDYAAQRGAIVVAAAGNTPTVGGTVITQHPAVVPVTACDAAGRPRDDATLAPSIARRGLRAPDQIPSLGSGGGLTRLGGTSAAAPLVTGTVALLWSEFPKASSVSIRMALRSDSSARRASLIPPLLHAADAHRRLSQMRH